MSLTPTAPHIIAVAEESFSGLWEKVTGLFGGQGFAPRMPLEQTPGIDPRFIPRAPMSNGNLDVGLLAKLSHAGFKRGREITPQTHPELHHVWVSMCKRAGLNRVPQLVLCDSRIMNAASLHGENAVMITDEMFRRLDLREATAVLGHELGHESSDHITPRTWAIGGLGLAGLIAGNIFAQRGGFGQFIKDVPNPSWIRRTARSVFGSKERPATVLGAEVYMALGATVGTTIGSQLSVHPTELDADRKGAMISGDPQGLASALSKLEGSYHTPSMGKRIHRFIRFLFSGYPSTENRISKLQHIAQTMPPGVTPVYQDVEGASHPAAQLSSEDVVARTESLGHPKPQVSAVSAAERVAAPEPVTAATL